MWEIQASHLEAHVIMTIILEGYVGGTPGYTRIRVRDVSTLLDLLGGS